MIVKEGNTYLRLISLCSFNGFLFIYEKSVSNLSVNCEPFCNAYMPLGTLHCMQVYVTSYRYVAGSRTRVWG